MEASVQVARRRPEELSALTVGAQARSAMAADAKRLQSMARRAVGVVATRVDRVNRDVVVAVKVHRFDRTVVTLGAKLLLVAQLTPILLLEGMLHAKKFG